MRGVHNHDIIDNRHEKLASHIKRILGSSELGRFAVGYFFASGLAASPAVSAT